MSEYPEIFIMAPHKILAISGDGVGPEIMVEAVKILEVIEKSSEAKFDIQYALAGGCSIDKHGVAITPEVIKQAKESDAVLFGSVGGPKW